MKNVKSQFKIKNVRLLVLAFSFTFIVLYAHAVEAARLYLDTPVTKVGVNQLLEIRLRLDSEGETINALEGKIVLPDFISIETIRDGNSLIALWTERPQVKANEIVFSGIMPGGWSGSAGLVFSFIAETQAEGADSIVLSDASVLLHDGLGTEAQTQTRALALRVDSSLPVIDLVELEEDREPPESFVPLLGQDTSIFDGDNFLVFVAQDKNAGIDYYEVLESQERLADERAGDWNRAASPYHIKDQSLQSFIYVRAVDRAGNIRVALFEPTKRPAEEIVAKSISASTANRVFKIAILVVVLLALIGIFFIIRRKRLKDTNINDRQH